MDPRRRSTENLDGAALGIGVVTAAELDHDVSKGGRTRDDVGPEAKPPIMAARRRTADVLEAGQHDLIPDPGLAAVGDERTGAVDAHVDPSIRAAREHQDRARLHRQGRAILDTQVTRDDVRAIDGGQYDVDADDASEDGSRPLRHRESLRKPRRGALIDHDVVHARLTR